MDYRILVNVMMDDEGRMEKHFAGYYDGADLIETFRGSIETTDAIFNYEDLAEAVFERHNRDDRPDGQMGPSLSVGDVIVFTPTAEIARAYAVKGVGFEHVREPAAGCVLRMTYRDFVARERRKAEYR